MKHASAHTALHDTGPQLLLVDDDLDDLCMLSAALKSLGVRTLSFDSGDKALYYLELIADPSDLPALIISDYNMPKFNGGQLLSTLKSNMDLSGIPVLMYSTGMSPDCAQELLSLGAESCLAKAFRYADFKSHVRLFKNRLDQLLVPAA